MSTQFIFSRHSIVFGLFAALPMFTGLTSVIRVTWSQENIALLVIPFMVLLNLFPMVIFVMTLLGILRVFHNFRFDVVAH